MELVETFGKQSVDGLRHALGVEPEPLGETVEQRFTVAQRLRFGECLQIAESDRVEQHPYTALVTEQLRDRRHRLGS